MKSHGNECAASYAEGIHNDGGQAPLGIKFCQNSVKGKHADHSDGKRGKDCRPNSVFGNKSDIQGEKNVLKYPGKKKN
jgi:hypothetical protein